VTGDAPPAPAAATHDRFYRGTIVRVFYGSDTGMIRSIATGREYRFRGQFVEVRGPIPRIGGLREGMEVGFDVGWTSSGLLVTTIRVYE
jgi:hypothetical protein